MDYDNWKATEPPDYYEGINPMVTCGFAQIRDGVIWVCGVPYGEHNDEELGHAFE